MLDREALVEIAKLHGLRPYQQEKHYVQSLALTALAAYPLVFKGGTYLWFFHSLKRFSEDLDFTATSEIPSDIDKTVSTTLQMFGVENTTKTMTDDDRGYSFRISAKGPLNTSDIDICYVYVEISKRENLIKPTLPVRLDSDPYQLPIKVLRGMALEEVAAEKIRAILTRDKARDLYDLFFLINEKNVKFDRILIDAKLGYYGTKFSKSDILKRINAKKQDWKKGLSSLVFEELPKFDGICKVLEKWMV